MRWQRAATKSHGTVYTRQHTIWKQMLPGSNLCFSCSHMQNGAHSTIEMTSSVQHIDVAEGKVDMFGGMRDKAVRALREMGQTVTDEAGRLWIALRMLKGQRSVEGRFARAC